MTKDYIKRQFSNYNSQVAKPQANSIAFDVAKGIEGVVEQGTYSRIEPNDIIDNEYVLVGDGKRISFNGAKIGIFDVNVGDKYRIQTTHQYRSAMYSLKNSNGDVLSTFPTSETENNPTLEIIEITIPENATTLEVCALINPNTMVVERYQPNGSLAVDFKQINNANSHVDNVLYGKKWAACGDSFTEGDFREYTDSNGNSGIDSDAYDPVKKMYKTYPWWIGNRNSMDITLLARCGSDFTNLSDSTYPFSNSATERYNYTQIPTDCDYITIAYGLNELNMTAEQIGTNTDSDNTTLWGAYNVVLEDILTKNPTVKIGIIITDASMSKTYHDTLIEIAKYWGIPYLDLRDGEQVPMLINGRLSEVNATAKTLRNNAFRISPTNMHPNVKGHEYRSTIIENFLRSL